MNTIEKYNMLEVLKDYIIKNKRIMIDDIASNFNVSYPTARRYSQLLLENTNIFTKIRNGIELQNNQNTVEQVFSEKLKIHSDSKMAIAKACVSLIADSQTIIIDSGSTCYFFSCELYQDNLKVVSTDLKVSMNLSSNNNISLISIGGEVRSGYYTIGGDMAAENLSKLTVDTAVMSADAIDFDKGITNAEMFEVPVKRTILKAAKKIILLADSSKFNKQTFYHVMPIRSVDIIISDSNLSKETAKTILEMGIELILV